MPTNAEIAERASSEIAKAIFLEYHPTDAKLRERFQAIILRAIEESQHAKSDNDNSGHSNLHSGNHSSDSKLPTPTSLKVEESQVQQEPSAPQPDEFQKAWAEHNKSGHATGWERVGFIAGFGAALRLKSGGGDDTRELREALRKYGRHSEDCNTLHGWSRLDQHPTCNCGFYAVLAQGEPQ